MSQALLQHSHQKLQRRTSPHPPSVRTLSQTPQLFCCLLALMEPSRLPVGRVEQGKIGQAQVWPSFRSSTRAGDSCAVDSQLRLNVSAQLPSKNTTKWQRCCMLVCLSVCVCGWMDGYMDGGFMCIYRKSWREEGIFSLVCQACCLLPAPIDSLIAFLS